VLYLLSLLTQALWSIKDPRAGRGRIEEHGFKPSTAGYTSNVEILNFNLNVDLFTTVKVKRKNSKIQIIQKNLVQELNKFYFFSLTLAVMNKSTLRLKISSMGHYA
jgi:hypothetical protein